MYILLPECSDKMGPALAPPRAGALATAAFCYQSSERASPKQRSRGDLRVGQVHAWGPGLGKSDLSSVK